MFIICHLLEIAVIMQLSSTDGRSGHSRKKRKCQKSKIYSLHSGVYSSYTHRGSLICQRGIFASTHREALTWQTEINLPLRITLSACVWPEGRLYSLKLMHPVNSTSGWHSWLASLLEMEWLQVPLHHPHIVFQPHSKGLTTLALALWGPKNSQGQQNLPIQGICFHSKKKFACDILQRTWTSYLASSLPANQSE